MRDSREELRKRVTGEDLDLTAEMTDPIVLRIALKYVCGAHLFLAHNWLRHSIHKSLHVIKVILGWTILSLLKMEITLLRI